MTVKHGGGSIMLWSAITYAGVGWMCRINGNIDKALYKEILEGELERTIEFSIDKLGLKRHQAIFQHNNCGIGVLFLSINKSNKISRKIDESLEPLY